MNSTQDRFELVLTDYERKLVFESKTPFMAFHINGDVTLPADEGRVVVTSIRHFIVESDSGINIPHVFHVKGAGLKN